jgi:ketosteroid isomerase-like protein
VQRFGVAVTVAAAALALSACRRAPDPAAARAAIRDADVAFAQATKTRGVDGWVECFADSGVQVTPGRNVVGRAAIRELMAPSLGDTTRTLTWVPTSAEVSESGDLGYTIGRWERTWRTKDGTRVFRGSYVTVWRKQRDGSWKVALDVGNPDPPEVPSQPVKQ